MDGIKFSPLLNASNIRMFRQFSPPCLLVLWYSPPLQLIITQERAPASSCLCLWKKFLLLCHRKRSKRAGYVFGNTLSPKTLQKSPHLLASEGNLIFVYGFLSCSIYQRPLPGSFLPMPSAPINNLATLYVHLSWAIRSWHKLIHMPGTSSFLSIKFLLISSKSCLCLTQCLMFSFILQVWTQHMAHIHRPSTIDALSLSFFFLIEIMSFVIIIQKNKQIFLDNHLPVSINILFNSFNWPIFMEHWLVMYVPWQRILKNESQ